MPESTVSSVPVSGLDAEGKVRSGDREETGRLSKAVSVWDVFRFSVPGMQYDRQGSGVFVRDPEKLSEELGNAGQLPEEKLTKDIGSYDFDCYWEQHMDGSVREMLQKSEETGTKSFWECPQAYSVFSLHEKTTGELQKRLILWELPLEYCMVLWEMGGELRFQRYEREKARKIIDSWWREET